MSINWIKLASRSALETLGTREALDELELRKARVEAAAKAIAKAKEAR